MKPPRIRREAWRAPAVGSPFRILFASDLHLGLPWTRQTADHLVAAADAESPDIVLLGGDLVDGPRGFEAMEACVRTLAARRPVAAIAGNHDVAAGIADVRQRVLRAGAAWLPDAPLVIPRAIGAPLCFVGGAAPAAQARAPAVADAVHVACLHDPADVTDASQAGFSLAFAGHLHGGQCVLFEHRGRLYPGAWFNPWTGLRFTVGGLRLLVSLGLGDTLPLRFNCPREIIVCDITPA